MNRSRRTTTTPKGWFVNLLGWASFLGVVCDRPDRAARSVAPRETRGQSGRGHAYLLVGGLAFGSVLLLVLMLRRGPKI